MGSIFYDEPMQVLQGGQITLHCMFETYVGSGAAAPASDVTIMITAAASGAQGTPVPQTGDGVQSNDSVTWNYTFTVDPDQATGDYLVTWAGTVNGQPQTWQVTVSVYAIPTGSPAPGLYASVAQYRNETGDEATPPGRVQVMLRKASRTIDHHTMGAVYEHTPNGMPSAAIVIQAFMQATCAQAEYMIADNDPTGIKRQYQSTSMGGVSLTRAAGTTALPFPPLAPEAAMILHTAGVLGVAVLVDWLGIAVLPGLVAFIHGKGEMLHRRMPLSRYSAHLVLASLRAMAQLWQSARSSCTRPEQSAG